jgi:pimeloyl-ACP methyl ester carboxylesterase
VKDGRLHGPYRGERRPVQSFGTRETMLNIGLRALGCSCALVLVAGLGIFRLDSLADEGASAQSPAPPGRLVDIGGRRLHVNSAGTGQLAVVVENGNSGFSVEWALVQPEVAKFARIITYDRAGYAWSDDGPTMGTVGQTCDDLHLLLHKVGVRPPVVLVGASIGGIYVRAYQRRFPEDVAGMVLDDATHEESLGWLVRGKDTPGYLMSAEDMRAAFEPFLRKPPQIRPPASASEEPFDRLPAALQASRLWAARKMFAEIDRRQHLIQAESWREEFIALRQERLHSQHPLGELPLIVLGRTNDNAPKRRKEQEDFKALSSAGKLALAENSGHQIHLYRPDLVVQAIRDVVTAVRTRHPREGQP